MGAGAVLGRLPRKNESVRSRNAIVAHLLGALDGTTGNLCPDAGTLVAADTRDITSEEKRRSGAKFNVELSERNDGVPAD